MPLLAARVVFTKACWQLTPFDTVGYSRLTFVTLATRDGRMQGNVIACNHPC
jgi:hypothetical protein